MIDLFLKGGPLMFPLLIGSMLILGIIIERIIVFSQTGIQSTFIDSAKTRLVSAHEMVSGPVFAWKKGPIQTLIRDIISMKDKPTAVIEKNASLKGDAYLHNLEKHLHLLELTGRIAPMIGLLGTVTGMVGAFRQVAAVQTVVDPSILAGGIWEALITTVFGLIVGIPSLIAHHLFTTRLEKVAFLMKLYSEEIISLIKEHNG